MAAATDGVDRSEIERNANGSEVGDPTSLGANAHRRLATPPSAMTEARHHPSLRNRRQLTPSSGTSVMATPPSTVPTIHNPSPSELGSLLSAPIVNHPRQPPPPPPPPRARHRQLRGGHPGQVQDGRPDVVSSASFAKAFCAARRPYASPPAPQVRAEPNAGEHGERETDPWLSHEPEGRGQRPLLLKGRHGGT